MPFCFHLMKNTCKLGPAIPIQNCFCWEEDSNATKISVNEKIRRHKLTLREGLGHRLPDLQWRLGAKGLWQRGGFQPYPLQQSWVELQCHLQLPQQPNSAKKAQIYIRIRMQFRNRSWNLQRNNETLLTILLLYLFWYGVNIRWRALCF